MLDRTGWSAARQLLSAGKEGASLKLPYSHSSTLAFCQGSDYLEIRFLRSSAIALNVMQRPEISVQELDAARPRAKLMGIALGTPLRRREALTINRTSCSHIFASTALAALKEGLAVKNANQPLDVIPHALHRTISGHTHQPTHPRGLFEEDQLC